MSRGTLEDLSDQERADVRRVTRTLGEKKAAQRLGIARATLASVLAELTIAQGTVALVRLALPKALQELDEAESGPARTESAGALPKTGT